MCRKFILANKLEIIEIKFNLSPASKLEWEPKYVVSPGEESLIITQQNPNQLTLSRFGMTPGWAKKPMNLINARAEGNKNPQNDPFYNGGKSIFLKPAFKRQLVSQRCLVIADAFIEWDAKSKQAYLVYLRNHERPFSMAGLYDVWVHPDTQAEHHGFSIITVPGNPLLHQISAARMPVILPKGRETNWLRSSNHLTDILGMLEIFPAERMNAYPLTRDFDKTLPLTGKNLYPAGDGIYCEVEKKVYPHKSWWHKEKGAGNGTWRANTI